MNAPQPIRNAVIAVSLCIGISALAALADRVSGRMAAGDFAFYIIAYAVMVMIPYKLAHRSNATRFVYVVLIALAILGWLGGISQPLPRFSMIASIIELPIAAASVYWLFFSSDAADWFGGARGGRQAASPVPERIDPTL